MISRRDRFCETCNRDYAMISDRYRERASREEPTPQPLDSRGPCVVKLLAGGLIRIPGSRVGDVYAVDNVHKNIHGDKLIIHVRDYSRPDNGKDYCIWTVGYLGYDCEAVEFKTTEGVRV
jgi:hypothetical protein